MFESVELGQKLDKADYEAEVPELREALLDLQERLRESDHSVVIVIAGAEGAGKGEVVNTLVEWMDARGITVHGVGEPTTEESERPPFYRFWRRLPPRGEIAVFFGSWYTWPIVERSFGKIDDDAMEDAMRQVTAFEHMLGNENVIVIKFWLHVTKAQQSKRFKKLAKDPNTAWRVTDRDWKYHKTYDSFVTSSSLALRRTDTSHAPWNLVEAYNRRFRNVFVGRRLVESVGRVLDLPAKEWQPEPLPEPARINPINQLDLGLAVERDTYRELLAERQACLGRLARRLGAADRSAVLVFEGADAAGKGGCIRRIVGVLDARFYRVLPISAPTDEEQARPYLWRFWRKLPGQGEFAIFDRSWYGRVLVERIEGFCPPDAWRRAFGEINDFEEQLVDSGTLVFKFWLAISAEEQLARFQEREATGHKRYKLTPEDWRNRDKWAAYEAAVSEMFEKTSTEMAPWTPVEANDKYHARLKVVDTLCKGLEKALD